MVSHLISFCALEILDVFPKYLPIHFSPSFETEKVFLLISIILIQHLLHLSFYRME